MTTQPEALRLADALQAEFAEHRDEYKAAAELRRLYDVERDRDEWKEATILANQRFKIAEEKLDRLQSLNAELLEVLQNYALPIDTNNIALSCSEFGAKAVELELNRRAAIAKADA